MKFFYFFYITKYILALYIMINEAYSVKNYFKNNDISAQKSNLSLFFSANSLIFCEFDEYFKNIVELCDVEFNTNVNPSLTLIERIQFIFNNYQITKNYQKVYISVLNSHFTLIPTAFKNEINADILQFGTGLTITKNTIEHSINNFIVCYTLDQELKQYLEKTFPIAFIRHAGAVTLSLFNTLPTLINCDLLLNLNFGSIEIAVKQKSNLQFYNVFNYQTNEDIIYYLLFTLEQLNLNPLLVKVVIAGQLKTTDNIIVSLKKYIKHINFIINDTVIFPKNELTIPNHYYFTVLNQHLCEL